MTRGIKRGDPVEFLRKPRDHVAFGDGEIGIATEDERADRSVLVELADGSTYRAIHVIACSWFGWIPEELEEAAERLSPSDAGDDW